MEKCQSDALLQYSALLSGTSAVSWKWTGTSSSNSPPLYPMVHDGHNMYWASFAPLWCTHMYIIKQEVEQNKMNASAAWIKQQNKNNIDVGVEYL